MKLHLFFSHRLTDVQEKDAFHSLGVSEICYLPPDLQKQWSRIPPELEKLIDILPSFRRYIQEQTEKGDYLLIQGDFGMTYQIVRLALETNRVPVYATTRRESTEVKEVDGKVSKTLTFQHIRFRIYGH